MMVYLTPDFWHLVFLNNSWSEINFYQDHIWFNPTRVSSYQMKKVSLIINKLQNYYFMSCLSCYHEASIA